MLRKNARKNRDNLAERWKFGRKTTIMSCLFLHEDDFQIMIFLADMAFLMHIMSNFGDFDKIGNQDDSKNTK